MYVQKFINLDQVLKVMHPLYLAKPLPQTFSKTLLEPLPQPLFQPLHEPLCESIFKLFHNIYVSLQLLVQNEVPAQPCVGKLQISLDLLTFFDCKFRWWFETP